MEYGGHGSEDGLLESRTGSAGDDSRSFRVDIGKFVVQENYLYASSRSSLDSRSASQGGYEASEGGGSFKAPP